jgi:hypothetical protein
MLSQAFLMFACSIFSLFAATLFYDATEAINFYFSRVS